MKMSKKTTKLLTIINVQQIVTYGICLILFVRYAIENILGEKNIIFTFTLIFLIALSAYLIYLNTFLIFKREKSNSFILIIAWLNFLQIFFVSLMGFNYFLALGVVIMPYFNYTEAMTFGVHLGVFNTDFSFYYKYEDKIAIGINIIPLIIFIVLSRIREKIIIEEYVNQIE